MKSIKQMGKILIISESGWRAYRSSLYYFQLFCMLEITLNFENKISNNLT